MELIIYLVVIIIAILLIFRYYLDKYKSHEIYKLLDNYGAIQICDKEGLIAILYKNRAIDWMRPTSIFKMVRIKEISDHFEEEVILLEKEAHCKIIKNWED